MYTPLKYALAAAIATQSLMANALTPADHRAWIKANQDATPQFVDGDTITIANADLIRPFIPVEQQNSLIFDGMEMTIKDAGDLTPSDSYKTATQKFAGQASLAADGALENYTAGRPFDPATFTPGSVEDGSKMAWNWTWRWENEGLKIEEVHWVWVREGGDHSNHEVMTSGGGKYAEYYLGGGTFERVLAG
ncbi:MAG: hypothetical protein ACI915_004120, partial [Gammaproteobacteria bacterium]